jgi:hypothetical protein
LQIEWARRGLELVETFDSAGLAPLDDPPYASTPSP